MTRSVEANNCNVDSPTPAEYLSSTASAAPPQVPNTMHRNSPCSPPKVRRAAGELPSAGLYAGDPLLWALKERL